jgi:hypothetical protein
MTVNLESTRSSKPTSVELYTCETSIQKEYEGCGDTVWSSYWPCPQPTGCKDEHQTEESHTVQKGKPRWDVEKLYTQRQRQQDTRCNWMWKREYVSAVEQYQEMYVRYYERVGCKSQKRPISPSIIQEMISKQDERRSGQCQQWRKDWKTTTDDRGTNWKQPETRPRRNILRENGTRSLNFKGQDIII